MLRRCVIRAESAVVHRNRLDGKLSGRDSAMRLRDLISQHCIGAAVFSLKTSSNNMTATTARHMFPVELEATPSSSEIQTLRI